MIKTQLWPNFSLIFIFKKIKEKISKAITSYVVLFLFGILHKNGLFFKDHYYEEKYHFFFKKKKNQIKKGLHKMLLLRNFFKKKNKRKIWPKLCQRVYHQFGRCVNEPSSSEPVEFTPTNRSKTPHLKQKNCKKLG
jgi:hypothetical protein